MNLIKCELDSGKLSLNINYELSELDLKVIEFLKDMGYLEIRDVERNNFNKDVNSSEIEKSIRSLYKYGIIDHDYDAWHETYVLTDFGKSIKIK